MLGPRRSQVRRCECWVLAKDCLLELAQLFRRLQPELVDEHTARVPIRVERGRLPARPVEREHELRARTLSERIRLDECLQLRDGGRVLAE